jgi:hypothetical protein
MFGIDDALLGSLLGFGGGLLSLFGGEDEKYKTSEIEYYDQYQGENAAKRQELWNTFKGMFSGAQESYASGGGSIDEAKNFYRQLTENQPDAVNSYVSDVLGGKYANLSNNPYYQGMVQSLGGQFNRSMDDAFASANTAAMGMGGGGSGALARERMLKQNTPAFTDAMSNLGYQAYSSELNRMNSAAQLGLQSYGMGQDALSTAASGIGGMGMFQQGQLTQMGSLLAQLLPSFETRVAGQTGNAYQASDMSQIGGALMELWGAMGQGQKQNLPTTNFAGGGTNPMLGGTWNLMTGQYEGAV